MSDSEDEDRLEPVKTGIPKMMKLPLTYDDESDYNSTSEEEGESRQGSPIPDDANSNLVYIVTIFLLIIALLLSCILLSILVRGCGFLGTRFPGEVQSGFLNS